MRPRTTHQAPPRTPWHYTAAPLAALSIVGAASSCQEPPQHCSGDLQEYEGKCLTDNAIVFVGCVEGRGINVTEKLGGGIAGTFRVVADASLNLAYEKSQQEDTAVALQIVDHCLALAEDQLESDQDRSAARDYQQRATNAIKEIPIKRPTVPECIDLTKDQLSAALEKVGLEVGAVTTRPDKEYKEGQVVECTPAAGTEVDADSAVDLVVSSGIKAPVPPCIGRTEDQLSAALKEVGLEVGAVTTRPDKKYKKGQVVECTPAAGTEVDADSAVDLVVSSGTTSSPASPTD
jgi:PASTA domain-containing protein